MDTLYEDAETGCCPRFDPKPWDEKQIVFKNKLFLKEHVISFFHIPLNFGQVMIRSIEKIKNADALPKTPLMLSDENSLFGSDIFIHVSKEVPGAQMEKISGTFLTKVFEGEYKNMGNWVKAMQAWVAKKNKTIKKMYFFYTTCPSCAKHYGKNYVVILAKV